MDVRLSELRDEVHKHQKILSRWKEAKVQEITELQKQHLEVTESCDEQMEALHARERKTQQKIQRLQKEAESDQDELIRLEELLMELKEKENELPRRHDAIEKQLQRQQQRTKAQEASVAKKEKAKRRRMHELTKGIEFYKERLGMEFQKGSESNTMKFIFIYIDPAHPLREFWFTVHVNDDDQYELKDCSHEIPESGKLLRQLNSSNNFSRFVVLMRREFQIFAESQI